MNHILFLSSEALFNADKLIFDINNQKLNFEIGDLNIYNVLATLAVLQELKIDYYKVLKSYN